MKKRVTASLDEVAFNFLTERAAAEAGGNVSAWLDKHLREQALIEAVDAMTRWERSQPGFIENMQAEADAVAAEVDRIERLERGDAQG